MKELLHDTWESETYWAMRHVVLAGGFEAAGVLAVVEAVILGDRAAARAERRKLLEYSDRSLDRWGRLCCMSWSEYRETVLHLEEKGLVTTLELDVGGEAGMRVQLTSDGINACQTFHP